MILACNFALWKFLRETRSVTAVEFAMIGPVLFLLIFAILLLGVVQFWQLTLDDAVRNATREVALGAGGSGSGVDSAGGFANVLCKEFGQAAPGCVLGAQGTWTIQNGGAALQFAVQGGPNFSGGGITPMPISAAGQLPTPATYSGMAEGAPFLVQVVYPIPFSIPLVPMGLMTLNGTPSLISAAAMVAEP
jgi:hypothetical protein